MFHKLFPSRNAKKSRRELAREREALEKRAAGLQQATERMEAELERLRRERENGPRFLIANTNGVGLGNKLLFLLYCQAYGRATGRTVVPLWNDGVYGPRGENYFWRYFEESADFHTRAAAFMEEDHDVSPAEWRGCFVRLSVDELSRELARKAGIQVPKDSLEEPKWAWKYHALWDLERPERYLVTFGAKSQIQSMPPAVKARMFPGLDDESIRHRLFQEGFKLRPEFFQLANMRREALGLGDSAQPSLGVHIRNTDLQPKLELIELFEEIRRYATFIGERQGRAPRVYLASDSARVLSLAEAATDLDIVTMPKQTSDDATALHLREEADGESRLAMGRDAIIELLLLGGCQYLYLQGNSSFSRVAQYFGPVREPAQVRWHSERVDTEL